MAKWRELGEVPDSDEESLLDSEESQNQVLPPPVPDAVVDKPAITAAPPHDASIWDLPPSSSVSYSPEPRITPRRPRIEIQIPVQSIQQDPESSPLSAAPEITDEDLLFYELGSKLEGQVSDQEEASPRQNLAPENISRPGLAVPGSEEDELAARRESARLIRALRPRKPIQEHPYLLENAQYSTLFKSHGVRPVKVPVSADRIRAQEHDSQEQEYEDDSQLTARNGQEDVTEGSQEGLLGGSFIDDRDDLVLSSSLRLSLTPYRQSASQDVLNSSENEDDLPSLDELFRKQALEQPKTNTKRKGSPKQSAKRKAPKLHKPVQDDEPNSPRARSFRIFDIPPSPPQTSPAFSSKTIAANGPKATTAVNSLTPRLSSAAGSRNLTPTSNAPRIPTIDLTNIHDLDSEDEVAAMSGSERASQTRAASSSPEPEIALQRRIKGVLPASWIRLDQQISHDKVWRPPLRRSPERSPERATRKGVAQRRLASPKPGNDVPFFFDDSDDDDMNLRNNDVPDIFQTKALPIFEDDAGSVIEEDHIDYMLPGRKGARADVDGKTHHAPKRMKTQKAFDGQPGVKKRQQRITGMLDRSISDTSMSNNRPAANTTSIRSQRQKSHSKRITPPRLSILDVIEADAPRFIKVAARAANRRPDKGRSSPSSKHISLGSRQDNIEALGILRNWRNGNIQSRLPSTAPVPKKVNHQPLQPISDNHSLPILRPQTKPAPKSRKLVKQTGIDHFISTKPTGHILASRSLPDESELPAPAPIRRLLGRSKTQGSSLRAAQLETAGDEQVVRREFHVRKRVLDALYRRAGKVQPLASETHLEHVFRGQIPRPVFNLTEAYLDASELSQTTTGKPRSRPRKLSRPRHIDTAAPQYAHANDPLPEEHVSIPEVANVSGVHDNKLLGLGLYGTHYTQNFEIFPLEADVYFHASTVIGQGRIMKAFENKYVEGLNQARGQSVLMLGDQPLRWGEWNAQTSSEFGVLFDWIADQMQNGSEFVGIDATHPLTLVDAADFSVHYVQEIICLPKSESGRLFVHRILEVISGFLQRLETIITGKVSNIRHIIEVLTRCLLVVLQGLRICEKLALPESLQVEELLRKIAKQTARALLQTHLTDIRNFFIDFQNPAARSGGIRNDHFTVIGWVVLIRILQESRIPRLGFWDVVCPVMLEPSIGSGVDAQAFERLWNLLFALLPLGEFDNTGVVVSGLRHILPLEGWTLPQKLLNRVFELYKTNQRQSPSFNDYCRALVGRCHYLVEQWGWRKGSSIIGTIFDFFASQNLSHLRNEEVYKSPQFLEELADSPSLIVQPEDRCFHIFLKLLALTIQRLRKHGLIKDVKNLIARVLPNHNRQYLKESDIHENDLASLRNHHDLLCTLFWCSPQALRPTVHTLEKLVIPGSSHKEACLINLRAWNQIARFVVSTGEDKTAYKPFADWQNNVFKQVLDQYSMVESDIQQQFLRITKDSSSGVSPELLKRVVNMNKQAAVDVLHFSLRANLDVMRHARSLATASFVLNTYQLHEVFTRFSLTPPDFDWDTQGVAVDIVDHYIKRIEEFMEDNSGSETAVSWHGEDAIMVLDRHISVPFFSMAQNLLANPGDDQSVRGRTTCTERTIAVAGRLAALFLHHGVTRLSSFFSTGKYGLFQGRPLTLSLHSRRYLCLFVVILIERNIVDFKGINVTPLELFLCDITKPYQALTYEYRLAEALRKQGDSCLKEILVPQNVPDYATNRDLFDRVLFLMRRASRFAAANQRQQLQHDFARALKAVMDQMKVNLKILVSETSAHSPYMQFVRMIIPLVKKHDFCPVDSFFYQISSEYSPSAQDPRLQTAQILSYGLKLEDGDTRSLSTLFYFLYSNFKLAMTNGKIEQERAILREGLENQHVFSFMLGRMLPAIVRTSARVPEAWLLLKTYVDSIEDLLDGHVGSERADRPYIYREIGQDSMNELLTLVKFVSAAINHLSSSCATTISAEYMHSLVQFIRLLNLFGPSMAAYLCLPDNSMTHIGKSLSREIGLMTDFTRTADEYVSGVLRPAGSYQGGLQIEPLSLLEEMQYYYVDPALDRNEHINRFSKYMEEDMQKTWYSTGSLITVKGPPKPTGASTQTGQGTVFSPWNTRNQAQELYEQLKEWNHAFDRSPATAWKRRPVIADEDILF